MPTWAKEKSGPVSTTGRKAARLCRPTQSGHRVAGQLREITKGHSRQRLQRPQERRNRQGRNRQPHAQRPQQASAPAVQAQQVNRLYHTEAGHPRQVEGIKDQEKPIRCQRKGQRGAH